MKQKLRRIKVKRDHIWEDIRMKDLKKGDIIKMFDGRKRLGNWWKVEKEPYMEEDLLRISCDEIKKENEWEYK